MDPILTNLAISSATSFVTAYSTKGDTEAFKTLDNLCYTVFGGFNLWADKKRAKHRVDFDNYMKSIAKYADEIPEENRKEPPLSIAGPALEASKYYIEEKTLRDMFAKHIAASMDNRKTPKVHQSFVEIIKQLSPLDAENLELFKVHESLPSAQYKFHKTGTDKKITWTYKQCVFLSNPNQQNIDLQATSITNLSRLGLLSVKENFALERCNYPKIFENHSEYVNLQMVKNLDNSDIDDVYITKDTIYISPFGQDFIDICL